LKEGRKIKEIPLGDVHIMEQGIGFDGSFTIKAHIDFGRSEEVMKCHGMWGMRREFCWFIQAKVIWIGNIKEGEHD
jgi:hypothetical protein